MSAQEMANGLGYYSAEQLNVANVGQLDALVEQGKLPHHFVMTVGTRKFYNKIMYERFQRGRTEVPDGYMPMLSLCDSYGVSPGTASGWCQNGKVKAKKALALSHNGNRREIWMVCPVSFVSFVSGLPERRKKTERARAVLNTDLELAARVARLEHEVAAILSTLTAPK